MNVLCIRDNYNPEWPIGNGHDSSIAFVSDGVLKYYLREERFSRRKRDPNDNITFQMAYNTLANNTNLLAWVTSKPENLYKEQYLKILSKNKNIRLLNDFEDQHHIAHAALSFYNSGFEKSLVIVIDSCTPVAESVYIAEYPCEFQKIYVSEVDTINSSHISICNTYDTTTLLTGMHQLESGKTMGLSSYGDRINNFSTLFTDKIFPTRGTSLIYNDDRYIDHLCSQFDNKKEIKITKENYKFYADYCKEIQIQTQNAVVNLVKKVVEETKIQNICISGGYGMNVVCNYNLIKSFPDLNFYFEPLSDDIGISIGTAMYYYRKYTQDKTIIPLQTTSIHGFHYDEKKYVGETKSVSDIAKILFDNKSVAVYSGLSESGQRALGNRSIFFNALNKDAKDIVNTIKNREWYRPFAAVVLEEDANLYFDMGNIKSSPFMTVCFPVKSDIIPGVTHVDNTCRVQTVSSGYLYELLLEFKKLSGHGILLNTSFNLSGEPLVETPEDAIKTLKNSNLDYLWFEYTKQLIV